MSFKYLAGVLLAGAMTLFAAPSGVDFNKDGIDDMLVRNVSNGQVYTWLMKSDGTRSSYRFVTTISPDTWEIAGLGDFNGDGVTDVLAVNTDNGQVYTWLMKSDGSRDSYRFITTLSSEWEIVGTDGDFNKDGINDIVVRNKTHGWTYIWLMSSGGGRGSYQFVTTIPASDWEIVSTASDFNKDGVSDIVVRNTTHGWTYVWLMKSDGTRNTYRFITTLPADQWKIVGTSNEFNRDGTTDLVVWKKATGELYVWLMKSDGTRQNYKLVTKIPDSSWEIVETNADFDKDGTSDFVVRNLSTGTMYAWRMNTDGSRKAVSTIATIPPTSWQIVGIHGVIGEKGVDVDLTGADWAAVEENGVWKTVSLTNGTLVYTPKTEKFGVAIHCVENGDSHTYIYQMTKSRLDTFAIGCGEYISPSQTYKVSGNISGVDNDDRVIVQMDIYETARTGNGAYQLDYIEKGLHDLVAMETDSGSNVIKKIEIRHDINVNSDLTGVDVTMTHETEHHGLLADSGGYATAWLDTKNGTYVTLGNTVYANEWYAPSSAVVAAGDNLGFNCSVFDSSIMMSKTTYNKVAAQSDPGTWTCHASDIANYNATTDGHVPTTFGNMQYTPASSSPPVAYYMFSESQNLDTQDVHFHIFIDAMWQGTTGAYTVPNFNGLSGWNTEWNLRTGIDVSWYATIIMMSNVEDPSVIHYVSHGGTFKP